MADDLPSIVDGSRLQTEFKKGYIVHKYSGRSNSDVARKEYWGTKAKLGGGSYGIVYLQQCMRCKGTPDVEQRAIKVIPTTKERSIDWVRELEAIMVLSHKTCEEFFVKSLGWFQDPSNIFIAMEYLEYGDLEHYLAGSPPLSETETNEICFQLLGGLRYMHGMNFAHRDLKPGNILIKAQPPDRWWVKIGDFGLSKKIEASLGGSSTIKGTIGFMAPELYEAFDKGIVVSDAKPGDMWSLGEIMFRLLVKQPVFESTRRMWRYVDGYHELPLETLESKNCGQDALDFFSGLMARHPEERFTAEMAYTQSWMNMSRAPNSPASSSSDSDIPDLDTPGFSFAQDNIWNISEQDTGTLPSGEWTAIDPDFPNRTSTKEQKSSRHTRKDSQPTAATGSRSQMLRSNTHPKHEAMDPTPTMGARRNSGVRPGPRTDFRDPPVSATRSPYSENKQSEKSFRDNTDPIPIPESQAKPRYQFRQSSDSSQNTQISVWPMEEETDVLLERASSASLVSLDPSFIPPVETVIGSLGQPPNFFSHPGVQQIPSPYGTPPYQFSPKYTSPQRGQIPDHGFESGSIASPKFATPDNQRTSYWPQSSHGSAYGSPHHGPLSYNTSSFSPSAHNQIPQQQYDTPPYIPGYTDPAYGQSDYFTPPADATMTQPKAKKRGGVKKGDFIPMPPLPSEDVPIATGFHSEPREADVLNFRVFPSRPHWGNQATAYGPGPSPYPSNERTGNPAISQHESLSRANPDYASMPTQFGKALVELKGSPLFRHTKQVSPTGRCEASGWCLHHGCVFAFSVNPTPDAQSRLECSQCTSEGFTMESFCYKSTTGELMWFFEDLPGQPTPRGCRRLIGVPTEAVEQANAYERTDPSSVRKAIKQFLHLR
ncbi:hypothetical protein ABW19_dt0206142 [Dactylella cylindrospora]|nr:hypothetical protein ABW19_dt0206142 [Dactylella cylindrospora]